MSTLQASDDSSPTEFENEDVNADAATASSSKELILGTLTPKEMYEQICLNKNNNEGYMARALIKKVNKVVQKFQHSVKQRLDNFVYKIN